jgi:hypothetical protein
MGGYWCPEINAGFEPEEVVAVNKLIMHDLGIRNLDPPHEAFVQRLINAVPFRYPPFQNWFRSFLYRLPGMTNRNPGYLRWNRFDNVVAKYKSELCKLSQSYKVVKDPRFCFTLPIWAASEVKIDHLIISMRSIKGIVNSMVVMEHPFYSKDNSRDILIYGMGICLSTIHDYRLSHDILRFPDFIDRPDNLFDALRFPKLVTRDEFRRVFARVVRRDLVHDFS